MEEVIIPILRSISFFFDNIVYGLISLCYELLLYLSNVDLFTSNEFLGSLVNRIYVLLGIFMLFKVSFSIIQYIVDPNAFTDSSKGFGKLVTNCLVSIVLLVSVPWIFSMAYELQGIVLKSNIIGNLIMGSNLSTQATQINGENSATTMARDAQFLMFSAFFKVNADDAQTSPFYACNEAPILGSKAMAQRKECLEELNTFMSENDDIGGQGVTLEDFFPTINNGDQRKFESFGALASAKKDGQFVINYIPIVSTLAGGYVVLLLITFCVDIAVRVLKLVFLQMVAPISIISYIDPKESMSNGKLHNWIKEVVSTYASLFIRLATIFLAMVLISAISSTVLSSGGLMEDSTYGDPGPVNNAFIYVFLIIGAFMFAKQVPQMIENLFGIKMSGQLNLNPLKSPVVSGMVGAGIGAAASGIGAFAASRDLNQKPGKTVFNTVRGFGSGIIGGGMLGVKSGGKNLLASSSSMAGKTARNVELRANTKWQDRIGAQARNAVGAQSKFETLENRAKMLDSVKEYAGQMEERAKSELGKKHSGYKDVQAHKAQLEEQMKKGQIDVVTYRQRMEQNRKEEAQYVREYINNGGIAGQAPDVALQRSREALERINRENHLDYNLDTWENIDKASKEAKSLADDMRASDEYENAKAVHEMQKSGMMQSHIKK